MPHSPIVKRPLGAGDTPPPKRLRVAGAGVALATARARARIEGFLSRRLQPGQRAHLEALFAQRSRLFPIPLYCAVYGGGYRYLQPPAKSWQILELQRSGDRYYFIGSPNGPLPLPLVDGVFLYVVLASDPGRVFVGLDGDDEADNTDFRVHGHTSLSLGAPVLFGGSLCFDMGRLIGWQNDSGHYQPPEALRHLNLIPAVQRLLPEALFESVEASGIAL